LKTGLIKLYLTLAPSVVSSTLAAITAGQHFFLALAHGHPIDRASPAAQAAYYASMSLSKQNSGDRIEIPLVEQWVRDRAFAPIAPD
jgi:hypothetical protein